MDAGIVSLPICCMHTVPDSEEGAALPLCLSLTSKQYKETLPREALLLDNLRRQKSSRWYQADNRFCLSEGPSETTKDFACLMVTSEFAEGDLKSAEICRLHYSLKREYNVVVECDPPSATVFCMPIGIERRISVNAGNGMCTEIALRKPVIQLHNRYSMRVKSNARTFAFMLLWSNKARGSITLELVGDKGPDTAMGGSSSQFTRAVHQKLVRLSSQFKDLQNSMKKVVEFIEKLTKRLGSLKQKARTHSSRRLCQACTGTWFHKYNLSEHSHAPTCALLPYQFCLLLFLVARPMGPHC